MALHVAPPVLAAVIVLAGLACVVMGAPPAVAADKGIVDIRLERPGADPSVVTSVIAEMGPEQLGARWTRIAVDWSKLQPTRPTGKPGYNSAYVDQLSTEAGQLHDAGIQVIITLYLVPEWASNKALWSSPPPGSNPAYVKGRYYSFYAPDTSSASVMAAYEGACRYLAETLSAQGVHHYECGNEPNLYCYQYPQTIAGDAYYGPRTYLELLKRFYAGVKAGDPASVVIAGANSPRGGNDAVSTAPQKFASYLESHGAAGYFDAYSHHPYHTGSATAPSPNTPPYSTKKAVTLYNIHDLLKLFPGKPFYITEYAYSTHEVITGLKGVTEVQQATYLRQAYAMVARYSQIKAMLWYLVKDTSVVFTGLQTESGRRKPSWYAFAGGNRVSLKAPSLVRASKSFKISGVLSVKEAGREVGQSVTLQSRTSTRRPWTTLKKITTGDQGVWTFSFARQRSTRQYRVTWPGVCTSPVRTVRTP